MRATNIMSLPNTVIIEIFRNLDPEDYWRLAIVCKKWRFLVLTVMRTYLQAGRPAQQVFFLFVFLFQNCRIHFDLVLRREVKYTLSSVISGPVTMEL